MKNTHDIYLAEDDWKDFLYRSIHVNSEVRAKASAFFEDICDTVCIHQENDEFLVECTDLDEEDILQALNPAKEIGNLQKYSLTISLHSPFSAIRKSEWENNPSVQSGESEYCRIILKDPQKKHQNYTISAVSNTALSA